jgi:hypothetical protein
MKIDKLRVVFDTSIYISAFVFPNSISYRAYTLAVQGKINLYSSPEIIRELTTKLTSPKFELSKLETNLVVRRISKSAIFVKPKNQINLLKDEPDNRILECAIECEANLIVSGDRHLTNLKKYKNIGIVRAVDLIHIVG